MLTMSATRRGAARLVDLGGEGFQPVPAAGHQRDAGTVLGELAGGGGADTAAGAGDEGGGAGQFRCHGLLSSSLDGRRRGKRRGRHRTCCMPRSAGGRPFGCSSIAPRSQPAGGGRRGKWACVLPVPVPAPAQDPVGLLGSGRRWVQASSWARLLDSSR